MDLNLSGKHALVCGASEGIGRAAAHELALLGADVTVLARRESVLQDVAASLPRIAAGQRHEWVAADVAQHDSLRERLAALTSVRPLHILINNTGGPPVGRAIDADTSAYLEAFQRHLLANQILAQAAVPGMRQAQWGRIVNVVSTSVKEPIANLGVSNTIRGAVASWAKTLSRELAGDGITVNNVLPGYTRTQRLQQILRDRAGSSGKDEDAVAAGMLAAVPAGRFADASEVAAAIAFLASPAAAYINGVSLAVDGGRMLSI
ncbi:SDR family oxidoreductase [Pseudoxanthomonas wuyuanensis]|uniref:3-oxoacyl-[acyl-carrier protein] reductase n=1 Tax=Pseudoxanthomonas wuyuanensis TaxID=1073196 RepID=A0A286CXX4_9GAMM|nr:SDR family oxidoreductase [Pseudoxanthomonas wuyuanensis]KAF1722661.1 short-chain dehydrogenase [Pseudoxanthomonas wuyuanensis]SOD51266.1 3-oxoacyl-[acyl-carrier protein] reductase [Pseudoxanthomonas wuyuanensis]